MQCAKSKESEYEIKRARGQGTGEEGKVEGMKWRVHSVEAPSVPAAGRRHVEC